MTRLPSLDTHKYRRWEGELSRGRWTWRAIVWNGLRLAVKQQRNKNLLLLSVGFTLTICLTLYILRSMEELVESPQTQGMIEFVRTFLGVNLSGVTEIGEYREALWRTLFLVILKGQQWWVVLVVTFVGPGLIANDVKARALPIYFAKPVTPWTYILGKWMVAAVFIGAVTFIPNIAGLALGVIVTGGLHTWGQSLHLAADLAIAGFGQTVLAGTLILALSSLTSDQRYVSVGWIAVFVLPMLVHWILQEFLDPSQLRGWLGSISLYQDTAVLNEWLLDVRTQWAATSLPQKVFRRAVFGDMELKYPAIMLFSVTAVSLAICYRRVVRFSRAAANM